MKLVLTLLDDQGEAVGEQAVDLDNPPGYAVLKLVTASLEIVGALVDERPGPIEKKKGGRRGSPR